MGKDNADDEAEKSDGLSEDHHENDSDKNVAVEKTAHTSITANTNGETRTEATKTDS